MPFSDLCQKTLATRFAALAALPTSLQGKTLITFYAPHSILLSIQLSCNLQAANNCDICLIKFGSGILESELLSLVPESSPIAAAAFSNIRAYV